MKLKGISAREFAKRDGCSDTLVRRGVSKGKIKAFDDGSLDPGDVGSDWRPRDREVRTGRANTPANSANTKPRLDATANTSEDGEETAPVTLKDAILVKEKYTGLLKQLEFATKSGALISAEVAAGVMFQEFRNGRDAWLNWPTSIAPHMAAELGLDPDKLVEVLTRYVHEHLTELGEPSGDFGASGGNAAAGGTARMDTPTTN